MKITEFTLKIQQAIEKEMKKDIKVEIHKINKNNGVILQGLMICKKDKNVLPTIYLEEFYQLYKQGTSFESIVKKIVTIYEASRPIQEINMDFFKDFQQVKDKIVYKLIDADKNKELLEQIPYIPFLDLAICFYYSYWNSQVGNASVLIYNSHKKMWNVNTMTLLQLAQENTPFLLGMKFQPIKKVIEQILLEQESLKEIEEIKEIKKLEEEVKERIERKPPMYLLSNERRTYGAACILYKGLLQKIAQQLESSFYILPSSVHEVIILADNEEEDPDKLRSIVREMNVTRISEQEYLSNSLYYYKQEKNLVKII